MPTLAESLFVCINTFFYELFALTIAAKALQFNVMTGQLVAMRIGDTGNDTFELLLIDLDEFAAARADEMVVMGLERFCQLKALLAF